MLNNETLAQKAASFKRDSRKGFDKAVAALIALAWNYAYMGEDFRWDADPELYAEALRICLDLSDTLAEKARAIAASVMEDSLDYYDEEQSWDREADEDGDESILVRFDQAGAHLLDLLEIWIALAFVHGLGKTELRVEISRYLSNPYLSPLWKGELRVEISRYLSNPYLSPLWKGVPKDALLWGRGYMKDIPRQLALIGQDAIISATRYAEWVDAQAKGAQYYIRRRGSGYDCPECDDLCGYPIPIETPFEFLHARCMCYPEYHFEPMPDA